VFTTLPVPLDLALFALAAVVVWWAGSKLAVVISALAEHIGMSEGFAGVLLLGGITSLPEIATAGSAGLTGSASLAVANLLGTASINVVLLCIGDFLVRRSLAATLTSPSAMLQGVLVMLLMTAVAAIVLMGDRAILGGSVGYGSAGLFLFCGFSLWLSSRYDRHPGWTVTQDGQSRSAQPQTPSAEGRSTRSLALGTLLLALLILGAGFVLSQTADAIASQTGVGAGMVGLVLVGFATSLPELSSILSALRIGRYNLAVGDVLGTNIFNVAVLFIVDLAYTQGIALQETRNFDVLAALLAVGMTGVYLVGIVQRQHGKVLRAGFTSWAALALYVSGVAILWLSQD